jgi:hypothetical protein
MEIRLHHSALLDMLRSSEQHVAAIWRCVMATGNDPVLDNLGMAHLGSPKALLGKGGQQSIPSSAV